MNFVVLNRFNKLHSFLFVGFKEEQQIAQLQARALYVFEAVACGSLCGIPPSIVIVLHIGKGLLGNDGERRGVNTHAVGGSGCIHLKGIDVLENVFPTCAVISLQKLVHVVFVLGFGHIGVHQKLCNEVCAQFTEFAGGAGRVALLKYALYVVFGKEFHVFTQNVEVGEGCYVVTVVCGVVPYVEIVANFAPLFNCLAELRATVAISVFDSMVEVTVDGGETNANVLGRLCYLGSRKGVVVSQGIDGYIGILLCNLGCNSVDKTDDRTCGAAFFLNHRGAFFTLAIVGVVVLRNRKKLSVGVFC